jgi:2-amino-4-hydroxy-6-hydroxymethyldihydropteridine diphosphokinase
VKRSADIVIGLGANLGNRESAFRQALDTIGALGTIVGLSHLIENPAVGGPRQPDYLNAAVRLRTGLEPQKLLLRLQRIEATLGRVRTVPWGPRTLDLDLLWAENTVRSTPELTLPHPLLTDRAFALAPLVQVAPEATDPRTGRRYADILSGLDCSSLTIVATPAGPPWGWTSVTTTKSANNPVLSLA